MFPGSAVGLPDSGRWGRRPSDPAVSSLGFLVRGPTALSRPASEAGVYYSIVR